MFTTAGMMRSAMRLKSVSVPAGDETDTGVATAGLACDGACATASAGSRSLFASRRPAAKLASNRMSDAKRRVMGDQLICIRRIESSFTLGQVTVKPPSRRSAVIRSASTGSGNCSVRLKLP